MAMAFRFRAFSGRIEGDTDGNGAENFTIFITGLTSHTQLVQGDFQFV